VESEIGTAMQNLTVIHILAHGAEKKKQLIIGTLD
jgi:hypothetical protein